jgi:exo-beta-1,3-glucanase (GH17 family)
MKKFLFVSIVLVAIVGCFFWSVKNHKKPKVVDTFVEPTQKFDEIVFQRLCYGPYRGSQNPSSGPKPTQAEIIADMIQIAKRSQGLRIYSALPPMAPIILDAAQKLKLNCLVGCWLNGNKISDLKEFEALIAIVRKYRLSKMVIGNEVRFNRFLSEDEMIALVEEAKRQTGVRVGAAETLGGWYENPRLAEKCDFLVVHIYGYWDCVAVDKSADYIVECYRKLKEIYPNKEIIIGETGWPTRGERRGLAIPGIENQKYFCRDFAAKAKTAKIPYFLFEAFDEPWKAIKGGTVEASWGILNRSDANPRIEISKFPFVVYDEPDKTNNFVPSGWMGHIDSVKIDQKCRKNPFSGKYCSEIVYTPEVYNSWAGVYWQFPESNWGDLPGYRFKGVTKMTFWARGDKGKEHCVFKVGGISSGKAYSDSLPLIETDIVTLTKSWRQYEIILPTSDLEYVISGLCWTTNDNFSWKPVTIYLDKIQYE